MTPKVALMPVAAGEIDDAFIWYEEQRRGLGEEFLDEPEATVASLVENPRLYPIVKRATRRAMVKRFPCSVLYRETEEVITIVARYHTRRDPSRRLKRT